MKHGVYPDNGLISPQEEDNIRLGWDGDSDSSDPYSLLGKELREMFKPKTPAELRRFLEQQR